VQNFICVNCGTQYPETAVPQACCTICEDEREFTPPGGQAWTTMAALRFTHLNAWRQYEPDLFGIGTLPSFGIAQRALLLRTPEGNILWDCITLLDDATVALVKALGGIKAVAISHPHYYSAMVEWARAFDATVMLHEGDRAWVMRPDPAVQYWSGSTHEILPGVTLINAPGHFDGATMLHWAAGAEGRGVLLVADIINVNMDRKTVSFMRSFPNLIPLPAATVRGVVGTVEGLAYDRLYGAWWDRVVPANAKAVVAHGTARYLAWLKDETV
jgi:hypothetical protein